MGKTKGRIGKTTSLMWTGLKIPDLLEITSDRSLIER
jgi:hypothetical protein